MLAAGIVEGYIPMKEIVLTIRPEHLGRSQVEDHSACFPEETAFAPTGAGGKAPARVVGILGIEVGGYGIDGSVGGSGREILRDLPGEGGFPVDRITRGAGRAD